MQDAPAVKESSNGARIESVQVAAYEVPTDGPGGFESDGTLTWSSTTLVLVQVTAAGETGIGYTYAGTSAAHLVDDKLKPLVVGQDPFRVGDLWRAQLSELRNLGQSGVAATALSAVDIAIWDLKARLLKQPLFRLLSAFHERVPVYGSGGFCNYPLERLSAQVAGWVEQGIPRVKVKTSRHPQQDVERLQASRRAAGDDIELMADANGALGRKEALDWAHRLREEWNVRWFEEPVSSDDRAGLRLIRDQGPPGLEVAAGEYGFVLRDFFDLLEDHAVDCLQADVTRCGGITGLLQVAGLCSGHQMALSAHCAPAASMHAFCAVQDLRHLEYFHDHVRVESLLFDGTQAPRDGFLAPDASRPGLGLILKTRDAQPFQTYGRTA